jgi:hypothetical protein
LLPLNRLVTQQLRRRVPRLMQTRLKLLMQVLRR